MPTSANTATMIRKAPIVVAAEIASAVTPDEETSCEIRNQLLAARAITLTVIIGMRTAVVTESAGFFKECNGGVVT